jgi:hypothetical protein
MLLRRTGLDCGVQLSGPGGSTRYCDEFGFLSGASSQYPFRALSRLYYERGLTRYDVFVGAGNRLLDIPRVRYTYQP